MPVTAGNNPSPLTSGPNGSVLLVANFRPDVGFAWWLMENFWVRTANLARQCGLSAIIAFPEDGPLPSAIVEANIPTAVHNFTTDGVGSRSSASFIREMNVKALYLTDRPHSSLAYARYRHAGARVIVTHDHSPGDRPAIGGAKGFVKDLWHAAPRISADLRICVSPLIRDRAISNGHIPSSRLAVVQNGIQPSPCMGDNSYARRVLGVGRDKRICVTVCRASRYKRVDFVVEVARRYVHQFGRSDVVFLHCGDGPDLPRLQALAEEARVQDSVVFAGKRSDVASILCSSDFALHPSQGEAFSLAILEYMNAGLVTFVPNLPSVCQAITHDVTGVIYPDLDADYVVRRLVELGANDAMRLGIGRNAQSEIVERFSAAQMNEAFDFHMASMFDRIVTPRR